MKQFKSLSLKKYRHNKGLTLVELLIAICIFSLVVLGFSSIETFSRYHVLSSDRRIKLQNDASYVLEHMAKYIGEAIGDANNAAVSIEDSNRRIEVYADLASDGSSPGDGQRGTEGDRWLAYQFSGSPDYEVRYYSDYVGSPASYEVLSRKTSAFSCSLTDNYVLVEITTCWNPAGTCASLDNPALSMKNRIAMPAVSTN